MLQRDRSGPQIRDKDNNPNQRKHVSKCMWNTVYGFKMSVTEEVLEGSSPGIKKEVCNARQCLHLQAELLAGSKSLLP